MAVIVFTLSLYNVDRQKKKLEEGAMADDEFSDSPWCRKCIDIFLQRTRNLSVFDLISGMTNNNTYFRFMAYISS